MNGKLKQWLDTLPEADRAAVVALLGDRAVESEDDRIIAIVRRAAGLPEEAPKKDRPGSDDVVRRAAGLPPKGG